MRPLNEQTVGEKDELVDEMGDCVVDLTPRLELSEGALGDLLCDQESHVVAGESDDSSNPIEFITENGFSILRPWESRNTPAPTNGTCRFSVSDGFIEQEVTVEISPRVSAEISM